MEKDYSIGARHFRTKEEYERARKDKQKIDQIRAKLSDRDVEKARLILEYVRSGKITFSTILGKDFVEELEDICDDVPGYNRGTETASKQDERQSGQSRGSQKTAQSKQTKQNAETNQAQKQGKQAAALNERVQAELKKMEIRRKFLRFSLFFAAACCFVAFGLYLYHENRTLDTYEKYENLKDKATASVQTKKPEEVKVNRTEPAAAKEVLEEYKNLLNVNKKLIGWLKIDDTNIDYPVVQTTDNEYYLTHNLEQEYDKNGSIFMDKDCDVIKPSTNYILYGHRMQSGAMFGKLSKYENAKYCKEHAFIEFDTIYEKGIYQVMYVFRSTIRNSDDVGFKYYQFIDANSEQEFDSNMEQMSAISLVDTGVTAQYGDQLLTLSTCDYYEKNGRFVVVAKKVPAKE